MSAGQKFYRAFFVEGTNKQRTLALEALQQADWHANLHVSPAKIGSIEGSLVLFHTRGKGHAFDKRELDDAMWEIVNHNCSGAPLRVSAIRGFDSTTPWHVNYGYVDASLR